MRSDKCSYKPVSRHESGLSHWGDKDGAIAVGALLSDLRGPAHVIFKATFGMMSVLTGKQTVSQKEARQYP